MNLPDIPGAPVEVLLFAALAVAAVMGAISVITARDPFISALSLIVNFVSLGVLYLLLDSPFVAVAQVLVYAGAVVVLFLFVIAYLGDRRELPSAGGGRMPMLRPVGIAAAMCAGIGLGGIALVAKYRSPATLADSPAGYSWGSAQAIGEAFLTKYVLVFEVTSLVLLVAAIGGIALGLTGRARHDRLRKLMATRSADEQRRWYDDRQRQQRDMGGGARHGATPPIDRSTEGAGRS